MTMYVFLWFLLGWAIGYALFYFRYQHKDTINELRNNLRIANKELQHLQHELEEFTLQNNLLKEKVSELLDKNDELSDVVSELSKYYVHLKKASEKSTELSKFLQTPNPIVEEKMQPFLAKHEKKEEWPKTIF